MLEQLLNLKSIKGSAFNLILLGMIYAFIGILSSLILFPNYVSIMSLTFTSILLIPSVSHMLKGEENNVAKHRHFSLKILLSDHKDVVRLYILLFLGVFLAYCLMGVTGEPATLENYFGAQLKVAGITGHAISPISELVDIVINNLVVFIICFILSLAYGAGSIIFIVWNASVWGVVFGYFIRYSAAESTNPLLYFFAIFIPFLPHMITEALSYIFASVMGGTLSKALHREKFTSKKFKHILQDSLLIGAFGFFLVFLAGLLEVFIFPLFL